MNNQYRFNLVSKSRITIYYNVTSDNNIIFDDIQGLIDPKITSLNAIEYQLNYVIAQGLKTINHLHFGNNTSNRLANIKFNIPCVGYLDQNNKVLPEFCIKHFTPSSADTDFRTISGVTSTLDIDCNLFVNDELYVADDIIAFATYHSSDINLKKDINTLTNCCDIVSNLNPVEFKWIKDHKDSVGFIAQEVEQVIPNIVSNTDKYKVLEETRIIAYLVGAIQELDKELRELEEE
jgi:hypothetical protein